MLQSIPIDLTSRYSLEVLALQLQQVLKFLNAYVNTRVIENVSLAMNELEKNVLPVLAPFLVGVAASRLPEASQGILEAQANAIRNTISQVYEQRNELVRDLAEVTANSKTVQDRLEKLQIEVTKERGESAAKVAELEQIFTRKETEREVEFNSLISDLRADFNNFDNSTRLSSISLVEELNSRRTQADQVLAAIGIRGFTASYLQTAEDEANIANTLRRIMFLFFGLGLAVAGLTFIKFFFEDPITADHAWSIGIRMVTAFAMTMPAWYAAAESARHRTISDRARQTAVELSALDPFIALMEKTTQSEIKQKLISEYFGKSIEEHTANPPLNADFIKEALKGVAEVVKQAKA